MTLSAAPFSMLPRRYKDGARDGNLVDIYIVHMETEWQLAKTLAGYLHALGYLVSPAQKLELPAFDLAGRAEALPSEACAVLVIWPSRAELFPKPALEARAAAQRGRLVQIYAGHERPPERYAGQPPVAFAGWDYAPTGAQWKTLLSRLKPLCGPPPKPSVDVVQTVQWGVLCATFVAALAASVLALGQGDQRGRTIEAAPPQPIDGMTPTAEPARVTAEAPARPLGDVVRELATADSAYGGPETYDRDLGVDTGKAAPADVAPEPQPPPRRPPQGPEPY
ncbi:MAG: hypothetical protein NW200_13025 [Hyphomonadaceae bacterium]|nr:hypothetical protein [Hyphomonadaceae bacterium]